MAQEHKIKFKALVFTLPYAGSTEWKCNGYDMPARIGQYQYQSVQLDDAISDMANDNWVLEHVTSSTEKLTCIFWKQHVPA